MENDSKTMSADNWGQIIRKDARGCFVEIKNDCFHLEKVHLQFVSYDTSLPKGSRYTSNINIYIHTIRPLPEISISIIILQGFIRFVHALLVLITTTYIITSSFTTTSHI